MSQSDPCDDTIDLQVRQATPTVPPERIGRYRVLSLLGEGGFGTVYLAQDDELKRRVAIKVPRRDRIECLRDAEMYLAEARTVASLDHPGIVPVYDVGRSEDGVCYVVSRFMEGGSLATKALESPCGHVGSAILAADVADALHHAHRHGLVHRDVKPGNILLDDLGRAYLADFGSALREEDWGKPSASSGTPAYMSPEQVRGEGHRVDGRTDVYSLGVVLYGLLTFRLPFHAVDRRELFEQITTGEPRPPRQWDDSIPKELEWICLKAMAKRVSDRYATASDLAEDLRRFADVARAAGGATAGSVPRVTISTPSDLPDSTLTAPVFGTSGRLAKIVPKGLRSFDAEDADFFLELLPGPRDRDGLPETIRFWKNRIEQRDPDQTFAVGLLYGPSGCGKTSLVKAGLLPRLPESIVPVYVEASGDQTEARLLRGLRKACPGIPEGTGLAESLMLLRRGDGLAPGRKVLLVLDQFEQWLHAHPEADISGLIQSLRQCDGGRVQCVVMVRDDFWMAATRFMRQIEIPFLEGQNSAAVDLFGARHAMKVLAAFGRAFGALPAEAGAMTADQKVFLEQAIAGLAEDGKVVCVRVALFAEMMKDRPWTPLALKEVGGIAGIGTRFLEETFDAAAAPPNHRLHEKAARAVLGLLLPETGSSIKGHIRSGRELEEASGYGRRRQEFAELVQILDGELRLISSVDPTGVLREDESAATPTLHERYFQLTHDYLVPSLREWLTRRQKESRRGRAELSLAERAAVWSASQESRNLPSLREYVFIRAYTRPRRWLPAQTLMMRSAARHYLSRTFAALSLLLLAGWILVGISARAQVEALTSSLAAAETTEVPGLLAKLEPYRRWAVSRLEGPPPASMRPARTSLHMDLARLHFGVLPPEGFARLHAAILAAPPDQVRVIAAELESAAPEMAESFWTVLDQSTAHREILAAGAVVARHDPEDPRWESHASLVSEALLASSPSHTSEWIENLAPVGRWLVGPLRQFFTRSSVAVPGEAQSPHIVQQRHIAASALATHLRDDSAEVSRLLVFHAADASEFQSLFEPLLAAPMQSVAHMRSHLEGLTNSQASGPDRDASGPLQGRRLLPSASMANAIIATLLLTDRPDLMRSKLKRAADGTLRSRLVHRLSELGVSVEVVGKLLMSESEPDVRAALLLSLGEYPRSTVPQKLLLSVEEQVRLSLRAADSGEHGAASWLGRRWGLAMPGAKPSEARAKEGTWYMAPDSCCMVILRGQLSHDYAIADHELTIEQYEQFNSHYRETYAVVLDQFLARGVPGDCPAVLVSIYDAMQYCNWLSAKAGLPQEDLCYDEVGDGTLRAKSDYLRRKGYRLPTLEEWVAACQAGAATPFSFGRDLDLLGAHAWYYSNSRSDGQNRARPVGQLKPNLLGLSDMYGNVWEWATKVDDPDWSLFCGGSCDNDPVDLEVVGQVHRKRPDAREHRIGFRIARSVR